MNSNSEFACVGQARPSYRAFFALRSLVASSVAYHCVVIASRPSLRQT